MRRAIFLAVPSLVLVVLVAGVLVIESRQPAEWQAQLDEYLEYRDTRSPGGVRVQAVARASKPWNFSQDMSHAVFGDRMWGGLGPPFPPEEVWCVLLKRDRVSTQEPGGEVPYQVVFVGYHTDRLWRQDWIVHERAGNPFAPMFIESLSTIGCDLGLEEMKPGDIRPIVMGSYEPPGKSDDDGKHP